MAARPITDDDASVWVVRVFDAPRLEAPAHNVDVSPQPVNNGQHRAPLYNTVDIQLFHSHTCVQLYSRSIRQSASLLRTNFNFCTVDSGLPRGCSNKDGVQRQIGSSLQVMNTVCGAHRGFVTTFCKRCLYRGLKKIAHLDCGLFEQSFNTCANAMHADHPADHAKDAYQTLFLGRFSQILRPRYYLFPGTYALNSISNHLYWLYHIISLWLTKILAKSGITHT